MLLKSPYNYLVRILPLGGPVPLDASPLRNLWSHVPEAQKGNGVFSVGERVPWLSSEAHERVFNSVKHSVCQDRSDHMVSLLESVNVAKYRNKL